ncbi:Replication-associated protein G2P [Pectobacterium brasiliense]|uniref:phage/plasmid replication domain-containing protein n=1 Tax=Pectobacterium TaxID=122277 RepID=UPI00102EEE46|nr:MULTISPECIES: phage/plasmid replication protein [Pectobacterium]MBA0219789.1 Replication-associated protein G2P [Pectobacterium brasiliense]MBN3072462.1 Replication-associated protein G2P [Pectobacterium brasiliense]MBN3168226.1 Replication-associated protein G2P [Pectobacterium brasiliense]TAJ06205.1 Replication-associated protein G2P [Pectobacterium versatile]
MFFDWLSIEQDFGYQLPILSDVAYQRIHIQTGEAGALSQPVFQHQGSSCDVVKIHIRGSQLKVTGNPSRWGRLDNLFGLPSVDACVAVYNQILTELGLPHFTKCTRLMPGQAKENERAHIISDGAIIKELHITSNKSVGKGNEDEYISGISTQPYRNSVPMLYTNGKTVGWYSKKGNVNLIHPSVYNKGHEIEEHSLVKIKNKFGADSIEVDYISNVIDFCKGVGIVRFEQKLKSRFLQKHALNYWGISDYSPLNKLHSDFLDIDKKLSVTAMDFETISEHLINRGVVETTKAANTTAMYAIQWFHGRTFDTNKNQVRVHRARLRKIGIDINQKCNISKFSPVIVKNVREIVVNECVIPDWYKKPVYLKAV